MIDILPTNISILLSEWDIMLELIKLVVMDIVIDIDSKVSLYAN